MNSDALTKLVKSGESDNLEFKTTTGARREAMATVCAMLNQRGGRVLFGVTPDGRVTGQQIGERTIEQVSAEIQRIEPAVFPDIERVRVSDELEVLCVRVAPGTSPPYRYRGMSYLRVGNTTRQMPSESYNRMLFERMHSQHRWENQIAEGWTVEDLDIAELRNTTAEAVRVGRLSEPGSREPEDILNGLGLMRESALLRAAVILFGKNERIERELPQCKLRVARFRGVDRSEFLDNRQFYGNAFSLLANAEKFLRETLPIAGQFDTGSFVRIDEPLYPPMATREALANALCHRDYAMGGGSIGLAVYDDRLEVTSTGPLHFGLTPKDLFEPHESRPWNPMIARTFYRRGIIEEWGRGTITMADLSVSAGLHGVEIDDVGDCVTVRFCRFSQGMVHKRMSGLTEQQSRILTLLRGAEYALSRREIFSMVEERSTQRRLKDDLSILKENKLIETVGKGRGARWRAL